MARAAIPTTVSTSAGVLLATEQDGDPVNGHYLQNSGKTKLLVRNAGAVPRTVTVNFYLTVDGQSVTDRAQAIPAGATWVFGPFSKNDYGTQVLIDVDNAELKLRAVE